MSRAQKKKAYRRKSINMKLLRPAALSVFFFSFGFPFPLTSPISPLVQYALRSSQGGVFWKPWVTDSKEGGDSDTAKITRDDVEGKGGVEKADVGPVDLI